MWHPKTGSILELDYMMCPKSNLAKAGALWVAVGLSLTAPGLISDVTAQFVTLTDNNSRAVIDPNSAAGMKNWSIQMPNGEWQNQLNQQWFWFRVGQNAEQPINAISPASVIQYNSRSMASTYANALLSVKIDYLLSGGVVGSGVSDIAETITINNLSSSLLAFTFFQYSDFNLEGTPGGEFIALGKNFRNYFNEAVQVKVGTQIGLTETVTTPGANRGEAAVWGDTLAKLNDGVASDLSNVAGPVGPGDVTWALQWNFNIPAGGSVIISKDKYLQVPVIPEPTTFALVSLGLAALLVRRRA